MKRKRGWVLAGIFLLGGIIFFLLKIRPFWVRALTQSFVQSDWSGGSDGGTTIDDNYLTGWNKYFSKDNSVETGTAGEVKLKKEVSQP